MPLLPVGPSSISDGLTTELSNLETQTSGATDPDMVRCPGIRGRPVSLHLLRTMGRVARLVLLCCAFLFIAFAAKTYTMDPRKQAWGCSGTIPVAQEAYCNQHFAIKIRILLTFPGMRNTDVIYKVKVVRVYKDTETATRFGTHAYITHEGPFFFTSVLENSGTYLVTGYNTGSKRRLTACSWITKWNATSWVQRRGFKNQYKKNCKRCRMERVDVKHDTSSCFLRSEDSAEFICRDKYSVCRYDSIFNMCAFDNLNDYTNCKELLDYGDDYFENT